MKLKPTLTKSEITYAKELYTEHVFSLQYIVRELTTRATTVSRYLLTNGVEVYEVDPECVSNRQAILDVFKHVGAYFEDLEDYNYGYILSLFRELEENAN